MRCRNPTSTARPGEFEAATAAVYSAQAKVKEAELNLGYTTIRSPVTGVASRSVPREGAYLNSLSPDAKLTYVAALDPIWVNFSVSQNQMAKSKEERTKGLIVTPKDQAYEVELVLPGGTPYPERGKISFADPSFSPDTGSFLVRAVLPNPKTELRPGMFVTALLHGSKRPNAIVVPQLAVQQGSNGHLVYVVKEDGTAEVRPVIVGDYYGEKDIVIVERSACRRPRGGRRRAQGRTGAAGESRRTRRGRGRQGGRTLPASRARRRSSRPTRCSPISSSTGRSSPRSSRS